MVSGRTQYQKPQLGLAVLMHLCFLLEGHAGAMLQARRLGEDLLVGIHSDEDIMDNKGPTVMTLKERLADIEDMRTEF
jgi:glycerol-3-phosphate cytidylyltransferase-like family protein